MGDMIGGRSLKTGLMLTFVLGSLTGCNTYLAVPGQPIPIRRIQNHVKENARVSVEGVVGDRAPLINAQIYELNDATGAIWVLSPNQNHQPGDRVNVNGIVRYQSIVVNGHELGEAYIEEQP